VETSQFPKRFDFKDAEPRIYDKWINAKAFDTAYDSEGNVRNPKKKDAKPFTIVIPPPNITGRLHMGHALNNTIQDVLIRYKRMDGYDALWIPGTDHAGIATQTVVKKQLDAKGIDYREIGRDEMIKKIWEWKQEFGDAILNQLRRIGCSCDWSRTRFTMDDGLSLSVRHSFVKLYESGLIYRGKRIVNWCPADQTALSDDEVEKEDIKAKMYNIRYPFAEDDSKHLVVSTTRPETLFGDVAVAVNPEDPRYKNFIGQSLRLPLQGRIIPIIADEHADPEKGTGCVKITPAHDPNDFEVGLRHDLEQINVMNPDASMNDIVPERFRGMDRYACRKLALEELEELGLLDSIDDHVLALGRSYRSKVPIEFRLSDQWFVKMEPMANQALEASGYSKTDDEWTRNLEKSGLTMHPPRHEKVYFHWLSNIRDWCISRQIWWGHRIPAWYNKETEEVLVSVETPEQVKSNPEQWEQETDVLDTWFSSWLWPMSTLGWPNKTSDFDRYYPTDVLSTGKDILFFWVARMNFAGLHFVNELPYHDAFLHSTITDQQGVTMSKSKGNGIDPLTLIEGASVEDLKKPILDARPTNMKELIRRVEKNFPNGFDAVGADAMRWTLIYSVTDGEQVRLSLSRFTEGRNFVTKLWNGAGRIIQALAAEVDRTSVGAEIAELTDEDRWILARLDTTIRACRDGLDRYDFGSMAQELYHFVWNDFCSWALELCKTRLVSDDDAVRLGAMRAMGSALADTLRLLHPIIPFVTEELYSKLQPLMQKHQLWLSENDSGEELLVVNHYPEPRNEPQPDIEARFAIVQRLVSSVRQLRATSNIKDNLKITIAVKPLNENTKPMLERAQGAIKFLAKLDEITFVDERAKGMAAQYDKDFELYIDLGKYLDLKEEIARLDKVISKTEAEIKSCNGTLSNPKFVERAPEATVREKQEQLALAESKLKKVQASRDELAELTK